MTSQPPVVPDAQPEVRAPEPQVLDTAGARLEALLDDAVEAGAREQADQRQRQVLGHAHINCQIYDSHFTMWPYSAERSCLLVKAQACRRYAEPLPMLG